MGCLKLVAYMVLVITVFVVGVGATIWTSRSIDPITDFLLQGERAGAEVVVPAAPSDMLIDC